METTEVNRELQLLEFIEQDPDISQASLASRLGVAVGTVNWHIKRLVQKGHIKVKKAQRRKLKYIITPSGITLRANLTVQYIENSMGLYRKTRKNINRLLDEVLLANYSQVQIQTKALGPDDILDICKLTCMERSIQIVKDGETPILTIKGLDVSLLLPELANQEEILQ